jgi:HD-GYP domain-containing protein (c-di-GMP phosphodiesterase class II)
MNNLSAQPSLQQASNLVHLAIAMTAETDPQKRLTLLLEQSMSMTRADGGTLYIRTEDHCLRFEIMRNNSLGIVLPDAAGNPPALEPLPLFKPDGEPNESLVAAYAVLQGATVNIDDAYEAEGFDFGGTREYDRTTGYRSRSFLTVPLKNHEDEVIGVLQLINALDDAGEPQAFSSDDQALIEYLATLAALILTNLQLIDAQKELFESFIRVIANAIDEKNPHTSKHCQRLPIIAMLMAKAVNRAACGAYRDFRFSDSDLYELNIAAWMHDCGKITTPEHVINKATKLEALSDRIDSVALRFTILKRDARVRFLEATAALSGAGGEEGSAALEEAYRARVASLQQDCDFIHKANEGGEFMSPEDKERVGRIAAEIWIDDEGERRPLLSPEEVRNLLIDRGTLLPEERKVINRHIDVTINMLESLPYPKHLREVPEIAGGHHEHMDGSGYPRGLTRDQLSVRARIMGIADIFEALTAADRPYKRGKLLSETLAIMGRMRLNSHIDSDLFDLFVREKVYLEYARKQLNPDQIDAVDHASIPGYSGD